MRYKSGSPLSFPIMDWGVHVNRKEILHNESTLLGRVCTARVFYIDHKKTVDKCKKTGKDLAREIHAVTHQCVRQDLM